MTAHSPSPIAEEEASSGLSDRPCWEGKVYCRPATWVPPRNKGDGGTEGHAGEVGVTEEEPNVGLCPPQAHVYTHKHTCKHYIPLSPDFFHSTGCPC